MKKFFKGGDAAKSEKMKLKKKSKGWSECSLQGLFQFSSLKKGSKRRIF